MNERILISGASIAGLTLAYWLARNGFQPTIVERTTELRTGGNGVDVTDDAATVIERMGLMPQVRKAAADVHGMKFVNAADRPVARVDTRAAGSVEIMRGDLVALLHEAAADVEIMFGDSIRALDQDADGVTVSFQNAPDQRFDLVVGADGMHSNVRRLAFGPEDGYVKHKDHYFAFANADATLAEDRWVTMFNTPGKMTGIYRSGNHAQAKAYFIFRSDRIDYDYRDMSEHKRLVAEAFADHPWQPTRGILNAALADPDFYFDALAQVQMDSWTNGRIALVGDAAWCASPASGAGAELALVGAYRLAGELAAANGDHRAAFPRYDASHRPLVDRKQQIGPNVGLMVPKTTLGRRVRNALVRSQLLRAAETVDRHLRGRSAKPLTTYRRPA
ncbi:FAD-dependent monooxygenase [Actinomadura rupiterrae]|uniref:FAD-dependent monooxygenase n=1 Tax=Actinomadura rupiterrae TaxID=559627 RepID=UPI0020A52328|nr:FAD-dependent monooxygenase [Actinomadura rupiterrae]MCP2337434.1 2-polyprenyl-6-methoxyphenol hydroxylase-like FAD-dependent oxidoreductase [Actinomadura rupiterrae]